MKVMILSDSHFMNKGDLVKLIKSQKADYYIHCGDIYMTFDGLNILNFYNVRGNNDNSSIKEELYLEIDGLKFWVVHGHKYGVDHSMERLVNHCFDHKVDVVCFGHTHRPFVDEIEGTIFINPGSVSFPRGAYRNPTYCIFDTKNKVVTFYDVTTNEICDPFNQQTQNVSIFKKLFKK